MKNFQLTVADGMVVSLDYTLRLDDGEVVDSSEGREPLAFLQGQGQIIPGLERALYGMSIGAEKNVVVSAADGYGEDDPDAYELVSRDMFPDNIDLTPGTGLRLRDGNSGQILDAYIAEVRGDDVVLDFNHPLAGETLYFHVRVAGLRPATAEELAHGHVHDGDEVD